MKNIIRFLAVFVLIVGLSNTAFASSMLNNYYTYRIYNQNYNDVNAKLIEFGESINVKSKTFPDIKYAYFRTKSDNTHFFVKIYPANKDTDIFVVSDTKYDKNDNILTEFFNQSSYKYGKIPDKQAKTEYENDFIGYARKGIFEGLAVLPDCLKPVKREITKLTKKSNNKDKQKVALPYKNEAINIPLTLVNTRRYHNNTTDVSILEREYRLKYKENKYTHAYEYIIYNSGTTPLTVKKIKAGSLASIVDVEAMTLIDFDKVDVMAWIGYFPPLIFLKIPAWYRNFRVAEETTRYAKSMPENYKIPASSNIKMVIMQYRDNPKPIYFNFERNGESFVVEF